MAWIASCSPAGLAGHRRRALGSRCSASSGSARSSARTERRQLHADLRLCLLLDRDAARLRGVRERLVGAVTRGRRRRKASGGLRRPARGAAVRVPGAPRAAGRPPCCSSCSRRWSCPTRPVQPARARARDRDLQRDHLGRRGAFGSEAWFRERRRLLRRLPAPLADQPVRAAARTGSSSSASPLSGLSITDTTPGTIAVRRGDARHDVLRRLQPHEHLAEPLLPGPGRPDRPAEPRRPRRAADERRRDARLRRLRRPLVPARDRAGRSRSPSRRPCHRTSSTA